MIDVSHVTVEINNANTTVTLECTSLFVDVVDIGPNGWSGRDLMTYLLCARDQRISFLALKLVDVYRVGVGHLLGLVHMASRKHGGLSPW